MSRASEAKKARRKKRHSARNEAWLSAGVVNELEKASELDDFDFRLTERGWVFSEDDEDETGVAWYWPPSEADEVEKAAATVILLTPEDDGQVAHVVFVGTDDDYQFGLEELFDHLEAIEAHRIGAPIPVFG